MELKKNDRDAYWLPRIGLEEIYPLRGALSNANNICAIDVGANRGFWTHQFLSHFGDRTARVDLLEPLPGNIDDFENLRRSGFFDPFSERITLHPLAASDRSGHIVINTDKEKSGLASANFEVARFHALKFELPHKVKVRTTTIDEFVEANSLDDVHCMKIDTEGHEMSVLSGAQFALRDRKFWIIAFEFGPNSLFSGNRFYDFFNFFEGFGYKLNRFDVGARRLAPINEYSTKEEKYDNNYTIFATRN